MSKNERIYLMTRILRERGKLIKSDILKRFEISEPTFKRDLAFIRDRLGAEIYYDAAERAYCIATRLNSTLDEQRDLRVEVPGFYLSDDELIGLVTIDQLIDGLSMEAVLGEQLQPIRRRIEEIIARRGNLPLKTSNDDGLAAILSSRIRILPMAARRLPGQHFRLVAQAVLSRQKLWIRYTSRASQEQTHRTLSPQRLVYHRDNWYLDAWCHLRERLSTFSVDAIEEARVLAEPVLERPEDELQALLTSAYGIFSGRASRRAVLRFSPERSRWVCSEGWHPEQVGLWEDGGHWRLEIPYHDDRELLMDLLRHAGHVEVLDPPELKEKLIALHQQALDQLG